MGQNTTPASDFNSMGFLDLCEVQRQFPLHASIRASLKGVARRSDWTFSTSNKFIEQDSSQLHGFPRCRGS